MKNMNSAFLTWITAIFYKLMLPTITSFYFSKYCFKMMLDVSTSNELVMIIKPGSTLVFF